MEKFVNGVGMLFIGLKDMAIVACVTEQSLDNYKIRG